MLAGSVCGVLCLSRQIAITIKNGWERLEGLGVFVKLWTPLW